MIEQITHLGWALVTARIIPDELPEIQATLQELANTGIVDLILTTGGTGCSPRDVTPEATLGVIEKNVPGIAEMLRLESSKINPHGMLSRGVAGICKSCLIINLPGSPKAAVENLAIVAPILPHAVSLIQSNPDAESGHQFNY